MIDFKTKHPTFYFVGIGGIGMSCLARYMRHIGCTVDGYDKTRTQLTEELSAEGFHILYRDRAEEINPIFLNKETIVVYTPAISNDNNILNEFRKLNCRIIKRSVLLGEVSRNATTIAVAGTHGKTTTSSMIADFLTKMNIGCTAFLGGVLKETQSNLILDHIGVHNFYVAEADEFDRSFLQLTPHTAIITSTDADHLDIYENRENLLKSFAEFADLVTNNLIVKKDIELQKLNIKAKIYRYSYNEPCDFFAENIRINNNSSHFDIVTPTGKIENCSLLSGGWVNIENAIAAAAAIYLQKVDLTNLPKVMPKYLGVRRRLDCHIQTKKLVYVDDYAHHPTELRSAISTLRELFPGKKMTIIFQPHLYSRTRDFAPEFAASLSLADEVYLLPIYPARELPIAGISSEVIFRAMSLASKHLVEPDDVLEKIQKNNVELLVTFGAGDIDKLIHPLKEKLS